MKLISSILLPSLGYIVFVSIATAAPTLKICRSENPTGALYVALDAYYDGNNKDRTLTIYIPPSLTCGHFEAPFNNSISSYLIDNACCTLFVDNYHDNNIGRHSPNHCSVPGAEYEMADLAGTGFNDQYSSYCCVGHAPNLN